nr:reverse transcriptase domain-containing protein [Tanacetum cinerariifolium]
TGRALIDVYEGELTLCVGKEFVTFNLDQTLRYSANYNAMSVNRIDLIDVACEEYSQEVLVFSISGNPTSSTEPNVSNSSPTLTPFRDKGTVSFVTSVSHSTTLGGEEVVGIVGPLYAFLLRVVIPFKSSFGLVMVLLGRVPEPEDEASKLAVEESRLDKLELGNPGLVKPVLDKLEAGFDHDWLLGRIGFFLGCSPEEFHDCFLDSCFDFAFSATISGSEEEVIELDDSLR